MKKQYLISLFLITISVHGKIIQTTLNQTDQQLVESLQTLNDTLSLMYGPQNRYYRKLVPEQIKEAVAQACQALAHLDPHSMFLSQEECKMLTEKMSSEFCGIGVILPGDKEADEEFVSIIETVPDGPSEKTGIKAGDKIVQIDEHIVKGLKIDEVMIKLRGEKNSKVTLKIIRPNHADPLEFMVTRDTIKDEISLAYYIEQHDIYYLLLSIFSEKSCEQVEKIMDVSYKKDCKGIIIDLRNNTGGLFDAAIDIAGLFLPKGSVVVTTKNNENKVIESWKTNRKPLPRKEGVPIFFIVNNYTASSSEILVGSLRIYAEKLKDKEHLNVFVVGIDTFGKGSVQEVIPLNGECALKMTTSLYYLPFDTCVQGKGIIPDFLIEPYSPPSDIAKWMQSQFGRESVLKRHIKPHEAQEADKKETKKTTEKDKSVPWKQKRQELLAQDFVLQNTVNLIDLLTIGKKANPKMISFTEQLKFLKDNYVTGQKLSLTEFK